jgi:DNA-binding GntR family transcriptional regulator
MSEPSAVKPLRSEPVDRRAPISLKDRAYLDLRDQIISLEIQPGSLLEEDELRTPRAAVVDLDRDVHDLVYRAAHNPFLEDTLRQHYNLSLRLWFMVLDRTLRIEELVRDHRALLNAIRRRRPPQAQEIAQQHVREFEQAIRSAI